MLICTVPTGLVSRGAISLLSASPAPPTLFNASNAECIAYSALRIPPSIPIESSRNISIGIRHIARDRVMTIKPTWIALRLSKKRLFFCKEKINKMGAKKNRKCHESVQ